MRTATHSTPCAIINRRNIIMFGINKSDQNDFTFRHSSRERESVFGGEFLKLWRKTGKPAIPAILTQHSMHWLLAQTMNFLRGLMMARKACCCFHLADDSQTKTGEIRFSLITTFRFRGETRSEISFSEFEGRRDVDPFEWIRGSRVYAFDTDQCSVIYLMEFPVLLHLGICQ